MTYVILIKKTSGVRLEDIEKYLKTVFKSVDHMTGFLEGYLFDNFKVLSLDEYEKKINALSPVLDNKWLKLVHIDDNYCNT